MREARAALRDPLTTLTRRQLVGAIGSGAMLGSAWAAAFRRIVRDDAAPAITVARTPTALAILIAYRGHRIIVVDAADGAGIESVTDLVTGLAHRRLDTLLAPAATLAALPRDYRDRWRIRVAWSLPDAPDGTGRSLAGRSLSIGGLHVHADSLPLGAWRDASREATPWYLDVTLGTSRIAVASDAAALSRMPLDAGLVNGVVCADPELSLPVPRGDVAVLVVPWEVANDDETAGGGPAVVPIFPETPVALRLRPDAIELPTAR